MFGWFREIWLRAKTLQLIEQEYGLPVTVVSGVHKEALNLAIVTAKHQGGNEYDTASKFMAMMSVMTALDDDEPHLAIIRAPIVATRHLMKMARPDQFETDWEIAGRRDAA